MQFRDNDRVTLTGTVKGNQAGEMVLIEIDGADPTVVVKVVAAKIYLDSHHFEVGDMVWDSDSEAQGTVRAVDDNLIWFRPDNGRPDRLVAVKYCELVGIDESEEVAS